MAEEGEYDGDLPIVKFDAASEDEAIANAGYENNTDRKVRRTTNRARAARQRRVNERMRFMHRELDTEFAAVSERGFRTPVANIVRVMAVLESSNDPNVSQALYYAQRAWIQLDQQNPASTLREEHVGESRSQAHSHMAGGYPRPQRSNNNDNVRPLVGGSSHLQGVTRDRPIISLFQKTCTNETKAKCTCQKKIRTKVHNMQRAIPNLP
jgi:hypothetical protein